MVGTLGILRFKCCQIFFNLLFVNFYRLCNLSVKIPQKAFYAAHIIFYGCRSESFPGNFIPEKFYILRNIHNVIIWLLIILIGCGIYCMLAPILRNCTTKNILSYIWVNAITNYLVFSMFHFKFS